MQIRKASMLVELEAKMATDSIDIECVDHAGMCTCRHVSCGLDAYMAWTHTHTHQPTLCNVCIMCMCSHVCMYVLACVYVCIRTCARMCVCAWCSQLCSHVCTCARMCTCMCMCVCLLACVYVRILLCAHARTHTHTHTYTNSTFVNDSGIPTAAIDRSHMHICPDPTRIFTNTDTVKHTNKHGQQPAASSQQPTANSPLKACGAKPPHNTEHPSVTIHQSPANAVQCVVVQCVAVLACVLRGRNGLCIGSAPLPVHAVRHPSSPSTRAVKHLSRSIYFL